MRFFSSPRWAAVVAASARCIIAVARRERGRIAPRLFMRKNKENAKGKKVGEGLRPRSLSFFWVPLRNRVWGWHAATRDWQERGRFFWILLFDASASGGPQIDHEARTLEGSRKHARSMTKRRPCSGTALGPAMGADDERTPSM